MTLSIEDAIAAAERQIQRLAEDYPAHLGKLLDQAEDLAARENWETLRVMAHDIKGQAGTVGWPILGAMAASLERCLGSGTKPLFTEATALHITAMRYCLARGIPAAGGEGDHLLRDLGRLSDHLRLQGQG